MHALLLLTVAHDACTTVHLANTDLCPGAPGYRTASVTSADECASACCVQADFCEAWVVRPVSVPAGNCSAGSLCCWTKPACAAPGVASVGATAGTVARRLPGGVGFVDTASWVGSSYTPARAANTLWWARFPEYEADVAHQAISDLTEQGVHFGGQSHLGASISRMMCGTFDSLTM